MEQNPKIESDNNIPLSPNDSSNINTQGNQEKKSSIRFLLILMGTVELTFLASLSPLKSVISILEFKKTIPFQIVFACIVIFASIQIILGFIFVIWYELYKKVLKKISIGALIFTPTFIILTFPLLIFTSIFPVNEEIGKVACTMEAKMCPDGSAVGRTEPNCEFAPCPTQNPTVTDPTSSWRTYSSPDGTFSFRYPDDWWIDEFKDEPSVTLFPPERDPGIAAENISFYSSSIAFLPEPAPLEGYRPFEEIIINGYIGRRSDEDKVKNPTGRVGGCKFVPVIYFPTFKGTLQIEDCEDLSEKTRSILQTLIIKQ